MKNFLGVAATALIGMQVCSAGTFAGNFTYDNDVALIPFTVVTPSVVDILTTSWAGGGFQPILTLFDGSLSFTGDSDWVGGTSGSCGPRVPDLYGGCLDAYIQATIPVPGTYTLALTQYGNPAVLSPTGTLSDGFAQDSVGNYTASMYGCSSGGSFLDYNCVHRSSNWSVDITGSGVLGAPEPMPAALTLPALLIPIVSMRRRRKHHE